MAPEDLCSVITQEGGRRIENECFPGGTEVEPEGNGAGVPFSFGPGLWSS